MLSLNCDPMTMAAVGMGGVVVGLVELGLGCVRRFPTWRISLGLVAALGLAGGAAYSLGEGRSFGQPALVLAGALLTLLLFRSKHSIAGRQIVQGAALTLLSGAMVVYGAYRLEQGMENELRESDLALTQMIDPIEENSSPSRLARTDAGTPIPLFETSPSAALPTPSDEERFLRDQRLNAKLIQTAPVDLQYNCHGWVFAGGRFWLRSGMVETILKDNDYRAVQQPRSGDVAVFRNHLGEVTHTGLVRAGNRNGTILIESKWGRYGRYVHGPDEHGYRGQQVTYYRTSRSAHLLQGIADPAVPAPSPVGG